jgi:hypothetical protein
MEKPFPWVLPNSSRLTNPGNVKLRESSGKTGGLPLGFNPEFALGISENIGGRVKRVKKGKCYNVDPGEP